MRLLIDICHPAHVHFFKVAINNWKDNGHQVFISARDKECALSLLDAYQLPYQAIKCKTGQSLLSLASELIIRDYKLYRYAKRLNIDCFTAIGGTCVAHISALLNKPSFIFYDSDNASLQNLITYPFAQKVITPLAYNKKIAAKKSIQYQGFHELAYLVPKYFKPNLKLAYENGIKKDQKNILIRHVARTASHDVGTRGLDIATIHAIINSFPQINFVISAEKPLPTSLSGYRLTAKAEHIHHVMSACDLLISDSTTMSQEAAVLGVPSIYLSDVLPGITAHISKTYNLIRPIWPISLPILAKEVESILSLAESFKPAHQALLQDHIDVSEFITKSVEKLYEQSQTAPKNRC